MILQNEEHFRFMTYVDEAIIELGPDALAVPVQYAAFKPELSNERIALDQVQSCTLTHCVIGQLHSGQWGIEQLCNAHHIVETEHGNVSRNFQALAEQKLVGDQGNTIIAANQQIKTGH